MMCGVVDLRQMKVSKKIPAEAKPDGSAYAVYEAIANSQRSASTHLRLLKQNMLRWRALPRSNSAWQP